ncbi:hypothetical protein ACH5RR_030822 [Cinchona calisaya]|uniref:Uncharacterized protein n=1 Tax=Cinchona calisaya TaxID=153742 RepID=A0ABD2YXW7_9GENT
MSRRRPLHTCGSSILAIVQNACTKAQGINGPMGILTRKTATFISSTFPFIYSMQYQWLAILSFADDHILTIENMVESILPPSIHLFNGIDKLVYKAECLPGRFDDALNTLPKIMHQIPFIDLVIIQMISWLNFLISTLMHFWGSKSKQEKDIMIDTICNNPRDRLQISIDKGHKADDFPSISVSYPLSEKIEEVRKEEGCAEMSKNTQCQDKEILCAGLDSTEGETKAAESVESPAESSTTTGALNKPFQDSMRCSYKEMLEKGTKENAENEEENDSNNNSRYETPRSTTSEGAETEIDTEKEVQKENIVGVVLNDPILELYEASWHLK